MNNLSLCIYFINLYILMSINKYNCAQLFKYKNKINNFKIKYFENCYNISIKALSLYDFIVEQSNQINATIKLICHIFILLLWTLGQNADIDNLILIKFVTYFIFI